MNVLIPILIIIIIGLILFWRRQYKYINIKADY